MRFNNPDRSPVRIRTAQARDELLTLTSALGGTVACFRAVALWLLVWASGSVWGRCRFGVAVDCGNGVVDAAGMPM